MYSTFPYVDDCLEIIRLNLTVLCDPATRTDAEMASVFRMSELRVHDIRTGTAQDITIAELQRIAYAFDVPAFRLLVAPLE